MGNQIQAGVLLSLRDQLSSGFGRAGTAVKGFGETANKVMDGVDKATSGAAAKLGALGLGFGAGATVKGLIDYSDRINRLGTNMGLTAAQSDELKSSIYKVAGDHRVKISPDGLTAAVEQIGEMVGNAQFAKDNLLTLGMALQATGASGEAMGGLAAEFEKMKLAPAQVAEAIGTITAQGNAGAFTLKNFADMGPRLYAAYGAAGRTGVKASQELGAVMQVIRGGTGSSEQAATAFEAMMRNLTDPVKQKALKKMGIDVHDQFGHLRSATDLIPEIVTKGKTIEKLGTVFDSEAVRAFNSSLSEFQKTGAVKGIEKFSNMVGGLPELEAMAAKNASSLKSNITQLQTSFTVFADNNLAAPLGTLSGMLNTLAEKPLQVKAAFATMAVAIGAVAAVKGFKALQGFVADFKGLNPKASAGGLSGAGASTGGATPVTVTNWPAGGLGSGGAGAPGGVPEVPGETPAGGPSTKKPSRLANMKAGAMSGLKTSAALGVVTAGIGVVTALTDKDSTSNEKAKAIGNSVGSAAGSVVGAAIGAGLGSIVPGIGTAIGGIVGGMLGGWLGGMGGESAGGAIETAASGRDRMSATQFAGYSTAGLGGTQLGKTQLPPSTGISGKLELTTKVETYDNRTVATVKAESVPDWMKTQTGSSQVARGH